MSRIPFVIGVFFIAFALPAQSIHTEFGKNRVQYHDDFKNWWQYETDNFITYWYGKARLVAQPTILVAESDHDEIQRILEHRMNDKIEIIVYTDISDLKQSNIGTEESFTSKAGETRIVGNKMFVYFDGNHLHLRTQIRKGIASVFLNNMLFGSNIQEIIQNALLLNIPAWYKEGVIAYAASDWNMDTEDSLRDLWYADKRNQQFDRLAESHPEIAGLSFWFFVSKQYGKSAISNLLYLTKISRTMENGFEYVLNTNFTTLKKDWKEHYTQLFDATKNPGLPLNTRKALRLTGKGTIPITQARLSPDGRQLAWVSNNQGRVRVYLRDIQRKKDRKILQYSYKNVFQETDCNYPLLAWHPGGNELTIVYEDRDVITLMKYLPETATKATQLIPTDFQRIYSASYINDLDYVFSATTDGYSDLYRYQSKNRNFQRLTHDFFDDLDAVYAQIGNRKGILFSSNRTTDSILTLRFDTLLPVQPFDICFLPEGAQKVVRLTRTLQDNERQPVFIGPSSVAYISDATGRNNTYQIEYIAPEKGKEATVLENGFTSPKALSNHQKKLLHHEAVRGKELLLSVIINEGNHLVFLQDSALQQSYTPSYSGQNKPTFITPILRADSIDQPKSKTAQPADTDTQQFQFQSRFPDPIIVEPIQLKQVQAPVKPTIPSSNKPLITIKPKEPYDNTRAIAANKKFALYQITTKMDNDLLFEGLESYTGDRQQLLSMPLGLLLKANVKDVFEDYEVEGGVRIPAALNGAEYFLVFNDNKYRIDRKFALYRRSTEYNGQKDPSQNFPLRSKKTTMLGLYQWKYPFDIYRSVRATASLRFDRFYQLSTDITSFVSPVIHEKRAGLKVEYVFDNTHDESLNIKHGTRYKAFIEAINAFDLQVIDGFAFDGSKGFTGIIGFDARHYIPVLKRSVIALRAAGASSFGSEKMLYYIGGIENWFFPSFNDQIPVPQNSDFAYKANAFQLRGFNNNIRNGSSYFLVNTELRIPFMQYLLGKNRGNAFIRNMQVTGFFDAGIAFHGSGPFSSANPLNSITLTSPPLLVLDINYFRDPLVMGYGLGFRTQLLGYFIKADYAWGIETRKVQAPRIYLSFGLDF